MTELFIDNLRRVAVFHTHVPGGALAVSINRARAERAAISANFDQIRNLGDSVVFEFGADRPQKMELRRIVRALQPQLRAYFLLELSMLHYQMELRSQPASPERDENISHAEEVLTALADHAEQAWRVISIGNESASLKARHDELCALIEGHGRTLRQAESQAGPVSYDLALSRWMLGAALTLGRSSMRLEQEAVLEERGLLSASRRAASA
jgi:hypothetical protein